MGKEIITCLFLLLFQIEWTIYCVLEGAGKTYTMLGTDHDPGIMALTLNCLFGEMEKTREDMSYKVTMSYLEVCTTWSLIVKGDSMHSSDNLMIDYNRSLDQKGFYYD